MCKHWRALIWLDRYENGIMLACKNIAQCKNQLTYIFGHLSCSWRQESNTHLSYSPHQVQNVSQRHWKTQNHPLAKQHLPTSQNMNFTPKASAFLHHLSSSTVVCLHLTPRGSLVPLTGTAVGLPSQAFLGVKSTLCNSTFEFNRSDLWMLNLLQCEWALCYSLLYTNHQRISCTSRLGTKVLNWKNHWAVLKEKKHTATTRDVAFYALYTQI